MMWVSRFFLAAFAEAELEALQAQGYGFPDPCWTLLVCAHIETLWVYKRFQVDYCSLILKVQTLHEVLHMGQHRSGKLCALIETEDKVPPFPSSEAMSIIREELGQDFSPIGCLPNWSAVKLCVKFDVEGGKLKKRWPLRHAAEEFNIESDDYEWE